MRLLPVLPFFGEIGSAIAAAEEVFNAVITRQPPPPRLTPNFTPNFTNNTAAAQPAFLTTAYFMPPALAQTPTGQAQPVLYNTKPVKTDTPVADTPQQPDPARQQQAEDLRQNIFDEGMDVGTVAHNRRMTEQEVLSSLGTAQGVNVQTTTTTVGAEYTITDTKTHKTIVIDHDYEKGSDSTTVTEANGRQTSSSIDGNGVKATSVYDPKTGTITSHIVDPTKGTTTDITSPKDGPQTTVTTDASGKKTTAVTEDGYTTTTMPDGKVSVRDDATGAEIVLESLSYKAALGKENDINNDLDAANKRLKQLQQDQTTLNNTPAAQQDDAFKTKAAQLNKNLTDTQAQIDKLKMDHRVLVAQFKVSQTPKGTKEYKQAITDLLDAVHDRDRVAANDGAAQKVADKGVTLAEANQQLDKYGIYNKAVEAYRQDPNTSYFFDPDGFTNLNDDYTGKLKEQEVILKNGQLYLRNTYEHHIFDGKNVLEIQITFAPGKAPRNRTDLGKQVDQQWQSDSSNFHPTNLCMVTDTDDGGWSAAKAAQKQAQSDYQAAVSDQAKTSKVDVDASIPDLKKIYDDAVKKYGAGTTDKPTSTAPKGQEPVQIQIDGKKVWVHPEVAAAYLALSLAEAQSASLDVDQQEADKSKQYVDLQLAEPAMLLNDIGSDDYDNDLWARHSDTLLATDKTLDVARTNYGTKQSDLLQTEIGVQNANIAQWRADHPQLAARLDALEKQEAGGQGNTSGTGPGTSNITLASYTTGQSQGLPTSVHLVRPPELKNFIGPVAMDKLVPEDPVAAQINDILYSNDAQPLLAARQQLVDLRQQVITNNTYQLNVSTDQQWTQKLQGLSPSERGDPKKRNEVHVDFARDHAQTFADPAQQLQQQLGGPITGRDASTIKSLVQKIADPMKQAGADVDVSHVVSQILNSSQINGDHPNDPLTIKPIAMQYEAAGTSMTTGIFQVTNSQGQVFLVDMQGRIWNNKDDFLDHNDLYSDKGILLMPKNLDTKPGTDGTISYEARTARNLSWTEKWFDPAIGIVTSVATVASFIPVVDVVAAPVAMAGGAYLGTRAVQSQVEYLQTGGSWGDGTSVRNIVGATTAMLPMGAGGLRFVGLVRGDVEIANAAKVSLGMTSRDAPYMANASQLMEASVFGRQGSAVMRTARALDGTALALGVPQVAMSINDLRYWDQMSGLDKANALMGLGVGIFGSGMGFRNLRRTAPGASGRQLGGLNGNPPGGPQGGNPPGGQQGGNRGPQSLSAAYHPAGNSPDPTPRFDPLAGLGPSSVPPDPSAFRHIDPDTLAAALEQAGLTQQTAAAFVAELMAQAGQSGGQPTGQGTGQPTGSPPQVVQAAASSGNSPQGAQSQGTSGTQAQPVSAKTAPNQGSASQGSTATQGSGTPFDPKTLRSMAPDAITNLSTDDIRSIEARHIGQLRPEQVAALTTEQIGVFSNDQVAALTGRQWRAMSDDQIRSINPDAIPAIAPGRLVQMGKNGVAAFTPEQVAKLTTAQLGKMTREQWGVLAPEQIGALTHDQVASLNGKQFGAMSETQIQALHPDVIPAIAPDQLSAEQVGALTYEQTAQLTPDQLGRLTPQQLAAMSPQQLYLIRGKADLTASQTSLLGNDQKAGLTAPLARGALKKFFDVLIDAGIYGSVAAESIGAHVLLPPTWYGHINAASYAIRGSIFALQAASERASAPNTWFGRTLKGIVFATFAPNIQAGVVGAPADPWVTGTYGYGSAAFAASSGQGFVAPGRPVTRLPQHIGNILFNVGSIAYMPAAIRTGNPVDITAGSLFAYGCAHFYVSYIRSGIKERAAVPKPASEMSPLDKAAAKVDSWNWVQKSDKFFEKTDKYVLGIGFGGGLLLFAWMGIRKDVTSLLSDHKKQDTGGPTPPIDITPPKKPEQPPQRPEPIYVTVGHWTPDAKPEDNSTLWDIALNNLDTLMRPAQKEEAQQAGLTKRHNADTLVADYGLPVLIEINPQYPLAENPDLIQPGWRLRVS